MVGVHDTNKPTMGNGRPTRHQGGGRRSKLTMVDNRGEGVKILEKWLTLIVNDL